MSFESKYSKLKESIFEAFAAIDMKGRILEFNSAFQHMLEYPEEELRHATYEGITPKRWHATDARIFREQLLQQGYSRVYQKEFQKKNGTTFLVELRTVLHRDETGQPAEIWIIVQNVPGQTTNDEENGSLHLEARSSEYMLRMGTIVTQLAHDLRQPLTAVLSNAQAALRLLKPGECNLGEIREILDDIVADENRASALISRMNDALQRKMARRDEIGLAKTVQEALDILDSQISGQRIQCNILQDRDYLVWADKAQIRQVILDLVTNSIEALQSQPESRRRLEVILEQAPCDRVQITVSDSGPGIPDSDTQKIFDPFWTTKDQAIGIGLFICRSVVQAHGGRIWHQHNPEGGASICFTLPLATAIGSDRRSSRSYKAAPDYAFSNSLSNKTRVLLVDDSESFRRATWSILANLSFMELAGEAADGLEAVQMAGDLKPDLILMDISLSGINGIEAAVRIRQVASESRILFLSQHDDPDVARAALHAGASGYVLKVNSGKDLLLAIAASRHGETFLSSGMRNYAQLIAEITNR